MTESIITEFTGSKRERVSRVYRYDVGGVRVLDSAGNVRRLYRFDPSSGIMTENDPAQPQKVLRRFVFDSYGMLEETFAFGYRPRTFRYEARGQRIVMREGGDYGAVGKTFSYEGDGIVETAFGRNGEIERVYVFDLRAETITLRSGGWYGSVERILVCERIDVSVFREPEAFLQFLMFTEKSAREAEADINEQVAKIRGEPAAVRNKFAYSGPRHVSDLDDPAPGISGSRPPVRPGIRSGDSQIRRAGVQARNVPDSGIDFIADADSPSQAPSVRPPWVRERGDGITFEERWQSARPEREEPDIGQSARIPIEERFQSSRDRDRSLSKGKSADIPLDERFQGSRDEDRTLPRGRSAEIPFDERLQSSRDEDRTLSRGRSAEISYEERRTGRRRP